MDRRELILAQLIVVLQSVPEIKSVYRNQTQISATQKPAIVLLDADEEAAVGEFSLGRPPNTPNVVRMSPQINIIVGGVAASVGPILNGFRLLVIAAILNDVQLANFVGSNGGIQYQGCVTDLGQGRTMEGQMILNFELHYPLLDADIS